MATFNMSAGMPMASQISTKDSTSWGFFDLDANDANASYFDDSFTYIEQETPTGVTPMTKLILVVFIGLVLVSGGVLGFIRLTGNDEYKQLNEMATMMDDTSSQTASYVEGVEAGAETVVALDKVMSTYQAAISTSDFSNINSVCLNSQLGQTYTNTKNAIVTVYDQNDGFVRIFDKMFKSFSYNIDKVIYNQETDTYYCYVDITAPNSVDIQTFVNTNGYMISKFFNNNDVTSANMINCLDNHVFPSSDIGASTNKICFEATVDSNGQLTLLTDTPLLTVYNNAYTQLLSLTVSVIKNGNVVGAGN